MTYDAAGRITSTTNELGHTTTYAYNSIGNVTSVTMPDADGTGPLPSPVISSTYDLLGRTVSVTAPNGAVSSVQYDNMGRTIQQTAADGSYVTMVYNAGGQVTSQSQHAAGNTSVITSTLTYDALGRVVTATDPAGTSSITYDVNGNRSSATDASGRTTTFVYDAWSRPIQTTDGSGNQSKVNYNASGQIASTTDGLNHVTTFGHDLAGRRITSTDSNGGVTSTNYDRLGRTTKLTDANGNITTWTFDAIGQLLTDSQGLAGSAAATRSYAYDPAGRLLSRTDRNGRTVTFSYDHLGRQTQQNWLGSGGTSTNTITTTYNAAMNVASISDNDSALAFTWDSMGRLLSSSNAGTLNAPAVTLSQTFNALGQRATEAATINGIADFLNTYTYDSAGRLSQLTQQDGNSSAGDVVTSKRVDLSYDAAGRFSGISRYQSLTTSQAVVSSAYLYDAAGRLTSLQHTGMENGATASNPLAGYSFTWDSADRLTSVNSVKDGLVNYSYDSTGQVTGADFTGQTDEFFTYDSNGNRTSVLPGSPDPAVTIGLHNRILNDGKFTYTYDAEGNRTAKTDNVSGSKVEYAWNHANLLTAVVYKTSNNVVTKSVAYQYDALGRRIGKSVDENGNGTVDRRESYIYDGAGLLSSFSTGIGGEGARRADEGAAIHISGPNGVMGQHGWVDQMVLSFVDADGDGSGAMTLASRNLYGNAVDQIFATESGSGDVFWALTDHQGTPRDWATRSASGTTTIAQHTRYTAFGAIESVVDGSGASLATIPSLLASFTGQLHDPDTDLLYYRARWYDPQLGKFLSDDPMGFEAGDVNVSRYVGNRTGTNQDASGLWSYEAHLKILRSALANRDLFTDEEIKRMAMIGMAMDCKAVLHPDLPHSSTLHFMRPADMTALEALEHAQNSTNRLLVTAGDYLSKSYDPTISQSERDGYRQRYVWEIGIAFHVIMDSTSPAHTDEHGWPAIYGGDNVALHSPHDKTGIETVTDVDNIVEHKVRVMIDDAIRRLDPKQPDFVFPRPTKPPIDP